MIQNFVVELNPEQNGQTVRVESPYNSKRIASVYLHSLGSDTKFIDNLDTIGILVNGIEALPGTFPAPLINSQYFARESRTAGTLLNRNLLMSPDYHKIEVNLPALGSTVDIVYTAEDVNNMPVMALVFECDDEEIPAKRFRYKTGDLYTYNSQSISILTDSYRYLTKYNAVDAYPELNGLEKQGTGSPKRFSSPITCPGPIAGIALLPVAKATDLISDNPYLSLVYGAKMQVRENQQNHPIGSLSSKDAGVYFANVLHNVRYAFNDATTRATYLQTNADVYDGFLKSTFKSDNDSERLKFIIALTELTLGNLYKDIQAACAIPTFKNSLNQSLLPIIGNDRVLDIQMLVPDIRTKLYLHELTWQEDDGEEPPVLIQLWADVLTELSQAYTPTIDYNKLYYIAKYHEG